MLDIIEDLPTIRELLDLLNDIPGLGTPFPTFETPLLALLALDKNEPPDGGFFDIIEH